MPKAAEVRLVRGETSPPGVLAAHLLMKSSEMRFVLVRLKDMRAPLVHVPIQRQGSKVCLLCAIA